MSLSPRRALRSLLVLAAIALAAPTAADAGGGKGKGNGAALAPLPAVATRPNARAVRRSDPRIESHRRRYLQRARINGGRPSAAKLAVEQRLEHQAQALGARIRATGDPRPILVIFEGRDGAGKSGTIRRLHDVFDAARDVHWGAPPEGETGHWLARYRAEIPGPGEVVIWDRSYYGRVVYDPYYRMADRDTVSQRYGEIEALEAELGSSVRIVKIFLDAGADRLARTIGKREAIAPDKLVEGDYTSFRDRKEIRKLFDRAIRKTGGAVRWNVVKMDDREAGHREVLDVLGRELI